MKVAVELDDGPASERDTLLNVLTTISEDPQQRIRIVDSDEKADWIVRRTAAGEYGLVPAKGWSGTPGGTSFGPAPAVGQQDWFRDRLGRIARVRNLLKLCDISSKQASGLFGRILSKPKACDIQLSLNLVSEDTEELVPIDWTNGKWELPSGAHVLLEIENTGVGAVDFSVLFIDSQFGITSLFPAPGVVADNRIAPGQIFPVGPMQVEADTVGLEHLLVIATRGQGQPIDFSWLSQDPLEVVQRSALQGVDPSDKDSVSTLLHDTPFSNKNIRGVKMKDAESSCIRVISWHTLP